MIYSCPVKFDSYFERSREKGDFLKTTIGHLGLNRGSNIYALKKEEGKPNSKP